MYQAIATLLGQQALAAALNGEAPLTVSQMVVGDGQGDPLETQTGLRNLRATVPIAAAIRDGNMVTFTADLDETVGGFTVREAGLLDADGRLLFVASLPPMEKLTVAENAYDILTLGLIVVVSETAQVTIQIPASDLVSIADMLRAPHITVDSATVTAPPVPGDDALYLVPPGATGAWAGATHALAQWDGTAWVIRHVPINHLVGVADGLPARHLRRTATGWEPVYLPAEPPISRAKLLFFGCL